MAVDQSALLADTIQSSGSTESPVYERRKGVITDYDPASGTASVKIGGDPTIVSNVTSFSNYIPQIGDVVWLDVHGNDTPRIVDRVGNVGPSVFATVQKSAIATSEARAALTYGDMATPGPSVSVTISGSGMLLVWITDRITVTSDNDGGAMSVVLSGANTVAASDVNALMFYPLVDTAYMQATRLVTFIGLNPGLTTVKAVYKDLVDIGSDVLHSNRELVVLPM